jgi:hypothetical protein
MFGGLLFISLSTAFSSDFLQISGRKETEAFGNMRLLRRKPKYDIVILVRKEKSEKRDGMRKKETKREKKRKK